MTLCVWLQDGGGSCASEEVVFLSNNVFSFITVKDVPDLDPQFIGTPYVGRIEENSAVVSGNGFYSPCR